jgi:hypothetical protein
MNKKLITLPIAALFSAMIAVNCSDPKEDNTGMMLLLLAAANASVSPTGAVWTTPNIASTAVGACKVKDGSPNPSIIEYNGYEICFINFPENECAGQGNAYGGSKFSVSAGSTSASKTDNLCVTEGYTICTDAPIPSSYG